MKRLAVLSLWLKHLFAEGISWSITLGHISHLVKVRKLFQVREIHLNEDHLALALLWVHCGSEMACAKGIPYGGMSC